MSKLPRITSKMHIRQSLGESRRFVEGFFGRGSASVKVTFNADTANKAHENVLRVNKKKKRFVDYAFAAAVLFPVSTKGTKNVMFLKKRHRFDSYIFVHEHAHAPYFSIQFKACL